MVRIVYAGDAANRIYSTDEIEIFYGQGGDDSINLGVGDVGDGGADDDNIYGVIDATMRGNTGDDLLGLDLSSVTTAITLNAAQQATSDYEVYTNTFISGFERFYLEFGSGDNLLDLSGAALTAYSEFFGGTGANTLVGGSGNDTLLGGGSSSLIAGTGTSRLVGGTGGR